MDPATLNNFKQRHEELLELVGLLRTIINVDILKNKATAQVAHEKLCELISKMKEHLAEEDRGVYPDLLTHSDPRVKTVAWNFIGGQKPLKKVFDDFAKNFKHCEYAFNESLVNETKEVLDVLCQRIESEQEVLFPELEKLGL